MSTNSPTFILFFFIISTVLFVIGCSPNVPEQWVQIGIPQKGIAKIHKESDQNGFYAEYKGYTTKQLMEIVSANLAANGFSEVCDKTELGCKGFTRNEQEYILKIDGGLRTIGLSIANEHGDAPLFFGICFKGYELGEPDTL